MNKKILFFLIFTITFPSLGFSAWFKLFSTQSADLYLDTNSIKKKNSIFFLNWLTINRNNLTECFPLLTLSEVDCRNLSIRILDILHIRKKWEKGTISIMAMVKKKLETYKKRYKCLFFKQYTL